MATVEETRSSRKISITGSGDSRCGVSGGGASAKGGAAQGKSPPRATGAQQGKRACSDFTVVGAHGRARAWGHNEDYSKVFATTNYLVLHVSNIGRGGECHTIWPK